MTCGTCGKSIRLGGPFTMWDRTGAIRCKVCADKLKPDEKSAMGLCFEMTRGKAISALRKSKKDVDGQCLLGDVKS